MALRVYLHEGGPFTEVETEEQAIRLMKLVSNGHRQLALTMPQSDASKGGEDLVRDFFGAINQNARRFLVALAEYPKGVEGEKLAEDMELDTSVFGGILGGISKNAQKHGFKTKAFVLSEMRADGARRYRHFQPGQTLAKYSSLLGEWVREEAQKNVGA